jgi:transcriptional regulator with XRE-family HTH domain
MDTAGQKLKRARERLKLRYREVEEASQRIADRHGNAEYGIALSRLSDIENKGTVPSIFRIYSLCAIYRLELSEVLGWYGVRPAQLPSEAGELGLAATHLTQFVPPPFPDEPAAENEGPAVDPSLTAYLGQLQRWGKPALALLPDRDVQSHRYGYIGLDDWSMYPLLQPGSLVVIDERQRKIAVSGWLNEFDRPIYFLEHRTGFVCGWCTIGEGRLVVQSHPASACPPAMYPYPAEIEVIGRVVGVAMLLNSKKRHRARVSTAQATSPDR